MQGDAFPQPHLAHCVQQRRLWHEHINARWKATLERRVKRIGVIAHELLM